MTSYETNNDLFISFRGFLILGRCLGLLPFSGVFKCTKESWKYSVKSLAGLTSILCILLLVFHLILAVVHAIGLRKLNAKEIAYSIGNSVFGVWGLFMYSYFLLYRKHFIEIFVAWNKYTLHLVYSQQDKRLKLTIVLVSVVMLSSTVLENAVLHLEYCAAFDGINGHTLKYGKEKNSDASALQMYYWRAHPYWDSIVGYHPILPILAFISHKLILYGGNYVDVMIALLARALYFKFSTLNKMARETLLRPRSTEEKLDIYKSTELERKAWNSLVKDHDDVCKVLNAMNNFLSPVIFVSYTINIYYFCMQLLYQVNPDMQRTGIIHSIYSPWSFIHVIARLFLFSICMATVNEEAHKTREIVVRCPEKFCTNLVDKLERKLNSGPQIGFSGLNCFTVTKPFMLGVLNVVFTVEIVLLQGARNTTRIGCTKQRSCFRITF